MVLYLMVKFRIYKKKFGKFYLYLMTKNNKNQKKKKEHFFRKKQPIKVNIPNVSINTKRFNT